jgi:hypothetical protein
MAEMTEERLSFGSRDAVESAIEVSKIYPKLTYEEAAQRMKRIASWEQIVRRNK